MRIRPYVDSFTGGSIALVLLGIPIAAGLSPWSGSAFADPPRYLYRELPNPGGGNIVPLIRLAWIEIMPVNARGDVIARAFDERGSAYLVWKDWQPHQLPAVKSVTDMNDRGQISGDDFIYDGTDFVKLRCPEPAPPWWTQNTTAMNNAGVVVGACQHVSVRWTGDSSAFIYGGQAVDVNDDGMVVGQVAEWGLPTNFLLTDDDLVLFGGPSEFAVGIGNDGFVIGSLRYSPFGIGWKGTERIEFPGLPGCDSVRLIDLTTANEIVGTSANCDKPRSTRPVIWINGSPYNLNELIAKPENVTFSLAWGINRHGHIVAEGEARRQPSPPYDLITCLLLRIESILAFEFFAPCLAGPDVQADQDCQPFDRNLDGAVDLRDFAAIQNGFR